MSSIPRCALLYNNDMDPAGLHLKAAESVRNGICGERFLSHPPALKSAKTDFFSPQGPIRRPCFAIIIEVDAAQKADLEVAPEMRVRIMGKSASIGALSFVLAGLLVGCASESLPAYVLNGTERPPFLSVQQDPGSYEGHRMVFGGEVLKAKRREDRTEIEVLQLPLNASDELIPNRINSQGRFLVYRRDFLDPAAIPPGTLITVVGEGKGSVREKLDEMDYSYPVLESEYIKVWPARTLGGYRPYPYPYYPYGYYGPWGYPYYAPYGYPFYPGPFFRPFPFRHSHSHFRHAPQNTPRPPQFRRGR